MYGFSLGTYKLKKSFIEFSLLEGSQGDETLEFKISFSIIP